MINLKVEKVSWWLTVLMAFVPVAQQDTMLEKVWESNSTQASKREKKEGAEVPVFPSEGHSLMT